MFSFLHTRKYANLVIKDHVIRYTAIRPSSPFVVKEYGEKYLPEGMIKEGKIIETETFQMILEECVEDWGLKGRHVRFIVPDPSIVIRKIYVPGDLEDDEIKGYLYMELGSSIHLPFDDPVFDVEVLGFDGEKKEVLLFAAPEKLVGDYSEVLDEVKLKPVEADISPLCIYRLFFHSDKANANDHLLLVQFDLQMVNLSIFSNHKPVFMRHLTMDTNISHWDKHPDPEGLDTLSWKGEIDDLRGEFADIYTEIERVMNFYRFSVNKGSTGITRVLLTGDNPLFSEIVARLQDQLDVPVVTIDEQLISDGNGQTLHRNLHLALGLALKEVK